MYFISLYNFFIFENDIQVYTRKTNYLNVKILKNYIQIFTIAYTLIIMILEYKFKFLHKSCNVPHIFCEEENF